MKYQVLLIILHILIPFIGSSQLVDSVYSEMNKRDWIPFNRIHSLHPMDDTSFVALSIKGRVYGIHINGTILWETGVLNSEFNPYMITAAWMATSEAPRKLILNYFFDGCDTYEGIFQEILDLETKEFTAPPEKYIGKERFIFPDLPGLPKYLFYTDSTIILYYRQDSIIIRDLSSGIKHIDIHRSGDFVVMTIDSLYRYGFEEDQFKLINKAPHFITENKNWIRFSTDTTFIISLKNSIELFNQQLGFVKKYDLPAPVSSNNDKRNWNDPYLIVIQGSSDPSPIIVLDALLNPVFLSQISFPERKIGDVIYLQDSTFVFTGEMYNYFNERNYLKAYDFKVNSAIIQTDVSITDFRYDEIIDIIPHPCLMRVLSSYHLNNVEIDIKNQGNTIIDKVIIASEYSVCPFYCWPEKLYHDTLENIFLMPGETKTFQLGMIRFEDELDELEDGLCIYALLPDQHLDVNGTNDKYCRETAVSTQVSLDENIRLYPNPVRAILYFSGQENIMDVHILEVNGRTILNLTKNEIISGELDVRQFSAGMYILQFKMKDGSTEIEKFVVN